MHAFHLVWGKILTLFFYFAGTANGEFSLREVYHVIDVVECSREDDDWRKILKLQVPERCRSFVWMLKHDRLLTNLSKSRKGLGHASCKLFGNAREHTLHAIRDCAKAMHIWKTLVPRNIMSEFLSFDL